MTSADSTAIVLYSLSLRSIWVLSNDIPVAYAIFFCLLSRGKSMVKGLKKKKQQKNTNKLVKSRRVKNQGLGSIHLTFKLPWVTKREFLLTISIEYQANKWWEQRKISITGLLVDPVPNAPN